MAVGTTPPMGGVVPCAEDSLQAGTVSHTKRRHYAFSIMGLSTHTMHGAGFAEGLLTGLHGMMCRCLLLPGAMLLRPTRKPWTQCSCHCSAWGWTTWTSCCCMLQAQLRDGQMRGGLSRQHRRRYARTHITRAHMAHQSTARAHMASKTAQHGLMSASTCDTGHGMQQCSTSLPSNPCPVCVCQLFSSSRMHRT